MLKVTCFKCQWSWSMNNEAVQGAIDSLQPGEEHYAVECPKCRRLNKVTEHQLKRALPRTTGQPDQSESGS